jgi:hypothetical protein
MDGSGPRSLTDSQLDRELDAALGIEPSPEFLARVRTRVGAEPGPSTWRPARVVSAFRRMSCEPLWGLAIVGIAMAIIAPQLMRENDVVPQPETASRIARVDPPSSSPVVEPAGPATRQATTVRLLQQRVAVAPAVASMRTLPLQLGPVLVSEDERRAFEFFVAAVNQGHVPEKAIERVPSEAVEMPALAIEPLVVSPMALARGAQQGEGQWE